MKLLDVKRTLLSVCALLLFGTGCAIRGDSDSPSNVLWQHCPEAEAIRQAFAVESSVWLSSREFNERIAVQFQKYSLSEIENKLSVILRGLVVKHTLTHLRHGEILSLKFSYVTAKDHVLLDISFETDPRTGNVVVGSGFVLGAKR